MKNNIKKAFILMQAQQDNHFLRVFLYNFIGQSLHYLLKKLPFINNKINFYLFPNFS